MLPAASSVIPDGRYAEFVEKGTQEAKNKAGGHQTGLLTNGVTAHMMAGGVDETGAWWQPASP